MNSRIKAHVTFWVALAAGVSADLLSKHFIFAWLTDLPHSLYDVWPGVFRFSMRMNTGGPFSILRGHSAWLAAFALAALSVVIYLYLRAARAGDRLMLWALAFVASGAVGNLFDRLAFGFVRDVLDVYCIHYPVFNVADILITIGGVLLVIELLRGKRKSPASPTTPVA